MVAGTDRKKIGIPYIFIKLCSFMSGKVHKNYVKKKCLKKSIVTDFGLYGLAVKLISYPDSQYFLEFKKIFYET